MTKTSITIFGHLAQKRESQLVAVGCPFQAARVRSLPRLQDSKTPRHRDTVRVPGSGRRWKSRCQKEKNLWQINSCERPNCLQLLFCRLDWGEPSFMMSPGTFDLFARNRILFITSFPRYLSMFFWCHLWKIKVCLVRPGAGQPAAVASSWNPRTPPRGSSRPGLTCR